MIQELLFPRGMQKKRLPENLFPPASGKLDTVMNIIISSAGLLPAFEEKALSEIHPDSNSVHKS